MSSKLTKQQLKIQQEAIDYIKSHKNELIEEFIIKKNPLRLDLITIFMAGSPGAGKTEFSKRILPTLEMSLFELINSEYKKHGKTLENQKILIHLDVDEIRSFLPQYELSNEKTKIKGNAHVIQKAANKGLDLLRKYAFANDINIVLDGTFSNYSTMKIMVKKSLARNRKIYIFYIYLDPISAWEFTKAREKIEGRNIIKLKFIEQYLSSQANVIKIQEELGNLVEINCIIKNNKNEIVKYVTNVKDVKDYFKTNEIYMPYSKSKLIKLLK